MSSGADWVLATEQAGHTRHFAVEALPVSIGGARDCDIALAGVNGAVQIGVLDTVFFVQPGKHTENVRVGGELLRGARSLRDGDVIALDNARLKCRLTGHKLSIAVDAQITAGDTAPPDLDALARDESEVAIAPVAFRPAALASSGDRRGRIDRAKALVVTGFVVLGVLSWFAFTAKSVQIVFDPPVEEFALPDTVFKFNIGDRYLLRSGLHVVTAELDGYYPLATTIDVGLSPIQTVKLALTKLPGLVTLTTDPEVGAEVLVDGDLAGTTPLVDHEIPPGTHQIEFRAERYLAEAVELVVAGGHERQAVGMTLIPNWAPVSVVSEPPGATVSVDAIPTGETPARLEVTAGSHDIEIRLSGHNAWRERITVVADTPLELPVVRLTPADGRVQLASSPSDAAVSVDGEFRGRTPLTLKLSPGRAHTITLSKPGYETARQQLSVAADSGRALEIELVAQYGEVDVQSEPPNAEIWVNDRLVGMTPSNLRLLAVEHTVELRLAGYAGASRPITPRPGFAQALAFELEPLDTATGGGYARSIMTSVGQTLRLVPAGRFTMGSSRREEGRRSNEVLREVEIGRAFYLGVNEVTNAEFRAWKADHDSGAFGGQTLNADDQPVANVSWEEAVQYLNWLSVRDGLQPVYDQSSGTFVARRPLRSGYRLPTEAEWAWAARAAGRPAATIFAWGDAMPPPDRFGNYADLSAAQILPTTLATYNDAFPVAASVGSFPENPAGIFDLDGNVAEWVQDYYEISVAEASGGVVADPLGPEAGRFHVVRGASWRSAALSELRLAYRNYSPDVREDIGFRIARNLE